MLTQFKGQLLMTFTNTRMSSEKTFYYIMKYKRIFKKIKILLNGRMSLEKTNFII